jgi:hypothetical protein
VQLGHASGGRPAAGREDVSDEDVLDEFRVEPGLGVDGAEDGREQLLGTGVLEAALLALSVWSL